MKRRWTITLLVILLVAAGVGLFKYWPRTLDDDECSALYRSYLHRPGIQSTYIKGKRLNDTLRIDLTLLQATTPQGWAELQKDFNIPQPDNATAALLHQGNPDIILSILDDGSSPTHASAPGTDTTNIMAASRTLQCVSIFHALTPQQIDAIVDNHIDQLANTTQTQATLQ